VPLTPLFGVNARNVDFEIWPKRTKKRHSVVWCTTHFYTLNHLGMDQCDRQTDRQTDRWTDKQTNTIMIAIAFLTRRAKIFNASAHTD